MIVLETDLSDTFKMWTFAPPLEGDAKCCDEHVRLFVCSIAYLENHTVELRQFCARCLRPWLGTVLATLTMDYVLPVLWMTLGMFRTVGQIYDA